MMAKRKRSDGVPNQNQWTELPPNKKPKMQNDHHLSPIPELRIKQIKIRHRLHGFCDGIINIMQSVIKKETQYNQIQVPEVILYEILSFSHHAQMQSFWISMEQQMKKFSFMIKEPHSLKEIIEFEQTYRQKIDDPTYQIPSALRTSLLMARSIEMPQIFKHITFDSLRSFQGMFESILLPLDQWEFVHEHAEGYYLISRWLNVDYCEMYWPLSHQNSEIATERMTKWFDFNSAIGQKTLCIGNYENENVSVYVFMNGDNLIYLSWGEDEEEVVSEEVRHFTVSDIKWDGDTNANDFFEAQDVNDSMFEDIDEPLPSENINDGTSSSGSQKLIFKEQVKEYCARWDSDSKEFTDETAANELASQLMLLHKPWMLLNKQNESNNDNECEDNFVVDEDDEYDDDSMSSVGCYI